MGLEHIRDIFQYIVYEIYMLLSVNLGSDWGTDAVQYRSCNLNPNRGINPNPKPRSKASLPSHSYFTTLPQN